MSVAASDPLELYRGVRELVALSALPAAWRSMHAARIPGSLAEILLRGTSAELVWVRLRLGADAEPVDAMRQHRGDADGPVQFAVQPVGPGGTIGLLVAGSSRQDFPTEIDSLVLEVSANHTAVVLQQRQAEKALQQSEERLRLALAAAEQATRQKDGFITTVSEQLRWTAAIVQHSGDAILGKTLEGIITSWNPAAERLYGYSAFEMIGRPVAVLAPADKPSEIPEILERLKRGETIRDYETQRVTKAGERIDVSLRISPIRDPRGALIGASTIARDITDRRRQDRQLREANEELRVFRRVIEESPDGISVIDRGYVYKIVNRVYVEMHGRPADEIVGRTAAELIGDAAFRDVVRPMLERCFAGESVRYEAVFHYPSGPRSVEARYYPLSKDGRVEYAVVVTHDLTERKRMTEQLRLSEAHLRLAEELSELGSFEFTVPPSGTDRWSDQIFRILGRDPSEGTLSPDDYIARFVHPGDSPRVADAFWRSVRELTAAGVEYRVVRPDGGVRHVHAIWEPLRAEDGVKLIGTIRDVTGRRRAEEALRDAESRLAHISRVATMGELATSIAHEVNQPLAAIVNDGAACLRWLQSHPPDLGEARESVRHMIADANRASHVIARIRTLLARKPSRRAAFDPGDLVRETAALVATEAARLRVGIRIALEPDLPSVSGDRIQIQQVLLNLMLNALEAMSGVDDRPRELEVQSTRDAPAMVSVAVRDSGVGIDPELVDRIFDPFYTTKADGLGMGLAISRSIVEEHGGQLWAAAHDGPGAAVQFTIPVASEDA